MYSACASPCQPSCTNRKPEDTCVNICEEDCVCMEGYILSGHECVPLESCGCEDDKGNYYKVCALPKATSFVAAHSLFSFEITNCTLKKDHVCTQKNSVLK